MTRFIATVCAALTLLVTSVVRAENAFHHSRTIVVLHSGIKLTNSEKLEFHFSPTALVSYLGVNWSVTKWFGLHFYGGWAFNTDEPLVSIMVNPHFEKFWMWGEIDGLFPSLRGYYFLQAEYEFFDWLNAGIEGEGWGSYDGTSPWSHGAGVNILLELGKMVRVDLALQGRDLEEDFKPEFQLRVHLAL